MSRKTVGLYKRYKFNPCAGVWSINFKRPLDWAFGVLPSVRIPDDLMNDYPEWIGNEAITWELILLRDPMDDEPIRFMSDIFKTATVSTVNRYQFMIPQLLWDTLKKEGVRKEWRVILRPFNYLIWDSLTQSNGAFDQFDIRFCSSRYGGYINDFVNNGLDDGDMFAWLFGEDYSSLYTKWECPVQVPVDPLPLPGGELVLIKS